MKRQALGFLLLAGCALATRPAQAVIGALDPVPAATLLLPYFEVDLNDPNGVNTIVAVANADQAPAIVHATMWTDLGVISLDWSMYLTGYDVVSINLRDLFTTGTLPPTEHVNDGDTVSPVGSFSLVTDPNTGVGPGSTTCNGQLPLPALPGIFLDHIRNAHRGLGSVIFSGRCSGVAFGDNVARGYITFDAARNCDLLFPGDGGYFLNGGLGVATNKNTLLGDYVMLNPAAGQAHGDTLVHLEAAASLSSSSYTFYYAHSGGADNREPLPTTFWARFAAGTPVDDTRLMVWRDSKRSRGSFSCGFGPPSAFPLSQAQVAIFDEDENVELPTVTPFPWAANSTRVNGVTLPVTPTDGWLYLNLNTAVSDSVVPFEPVMQNHVATLQSATGLFSVGLMAFPLDSALAPLDVSLPTCDGDPDPPACGERAQRIPDSLPGN